MVILKITASLCLCCEVVKRKKEVLLTLLWEAFWFLLPALITHISGFLLPIQSVLHVLNLWSFYLLTEWSKASYLTSLILFPQYQNEKSHRVAMRNLAIAEGLTTGPGTSCSGLLASLHSHFLFLMDYSIGYAHWEIF